MTRFSYFLISTLLFLATLAMFILLIKEIDMEAMTIAVKTIFMQVLLLFVVIFLLILSLYFFFKGKKEGRPKKHIRFL